MIEVKNLNFSIENKKIIQNISIRVKQNQFIGIIGANGSGKSTLLKNIYRFLKYDSGSIKLKNIDLYHYSSKELAKEMAILAQKQNMNFDFSVEEIVEMGRYAYKHSVFNSEKNKNSKFLEKALNAVGMYKMKDKSFLELSGGEMQRVLIARALAQNTEILILDEPTNHLDIKYQIQIMKLIKKTKKTILAVIHDMNIASSYCDYIYALKNGKISLAGSPEKIFTKEKIKAIFDVEADVLINPKNKKPLIVF